MYVVIKYDVKSLMAWRNFQGRLLLIYLNFSHLNYKDDICWLYQLKQQMFKGHTVLPMASPTLPLTFATLNTILFPLLIKTYICILFFLKKRDYAMHIILQLCFALSNMYWKHFEGSNISSTFFRLATQIAWCGCTVIYSVPVFPY